jgi:hypothetical protein
MNLSINRSYRDLSISSGGAMVVTSLLACISQRLEVERPQPGRSFVSLIADSLIFHAHTRTT